jgi:hypothetical protein
MNIWQNSTRWQKAQYNVLFGAVFLFFTVRSIVCYPFRKIKKMYNKARGR